LEEVIGFCSSVGLPVTLEDLGVEEKEENIRIIAEKAIPDIASEPFELTETMLFNAIKVASELGRIIKWTESLTTCLSRDRQLGVLRKL
jgi:glycerol dehydrogenase